jgi:hypothetical protein
MGVGRSFRKKPVRRPIKSGSSRRRRQGEHRDRLVALGISETRVKSMNPKQVRQLLQRPVKTKALAAKQK